MREKIIAGNWKMNMDLNGAKELAKNIADSPKSVKVILCPPYTMISTVAKEINNCDVLLGAQNMNENEKGAYTGEISASMLINLGVSHVIVGHSERRTYYNETDKSVNCKVKCAIKNNITPIICVGESLEIKESGNAVNFVCEQVKMALTGIEDVTKVIIAYEPIWAIGTGKTATPDDANDMIKAIRNQIDTMFDTSDVSILYGGSMNENNVSQLMNMSDIDGGLIGSASLDFDKFNKIINVSKV